MKMRRQPRRWGRWVARTGLLLASLCTVTLPFSSAVGQVSELRPGAYVRLRAPGTVAGEAEGVILSRNRDTLVVAYTGAACVAVPIASITHAAVYRGRTRRAGALKGAKWGAGVGLGLGVFNIGFSDCSGEHCGARDNVAGVAAFTAIGAGVGSLVGAVVRGEHWERLHLPPHANSPLVTTRLGSWP